MISTWRNITLYTSYPSNQETSLWNIECTQHGAVRQIDNVFAYLRKNPTSVSDKNEHKKCDVSRHSVRFLGHVLRISANMEKSHALQVHQTGMPRLRCLLTNYYNCENVHYSPSYSTSKEKRQEEDKGQETTFKKLCRCFSIRAGAFILQECGRKVESFHLASYVCIDPYRVVGYAFYPGFRPVFSAAKLVVGFVMGLV